MAKPDPMSWVRVLDEDTGHKRTVRHIELPHGNYRVLDEPAVHDATFEPLPPEFKSVEPTGQKAATKKE